MLTSIIISFFLLVNGNSNPHYVLRTDGVYVYDNRKDTILYANDKLAADLLKMVENEGVKQNTKLKSCVPNGKMLAPGGTWIYYIMFVNNSAGFADGTVCRQRYNMQRRINDFKAMAKGQTVDKDYDDLYKVMDVKISGNTISFLQGTNPYYQQIFRGKIYQDMLDLTVAIKEVESAGKTDPDYHRVYKFYTFKELEQMFRSKREDEKLYFKK